MVSTARRPTQARVNAGVAHASAPHRGERADDRRAIALTQHLFLRGGHLDGRAVLEVPFVEGFCRSCSSPGQVKWARSGPRYCTQRRAVRWAWGSALCTLMGCGGRVGIRQGVHAGKIGAEIGDPRGGYGTTSVNVP